MSFTKNERILLINQCLILEKLYPNEGDYYQQLREILQSGYELQYSKVGEMISDGVSEEVCKEVQEILDMYSHLAYSFDALKDKGELTKEAIKFPGFDGNYETAQMGYAIFLIEKQKRFEILKRSTDYNSHAPLLTLYRAMLKNWIPVRFQRDLTVEHMLDILNTEVQAGKVVNFPH